MAASVGATWQVPEVHGFHGSSPKPLEVRVLYGATGTGKTARAMALTQRAYKWGPHNGAWFDGYCGQSDLILDEYRGQLEYGFLLTMLDKYPYRLQEKGGMMESRIKRVIITSPMHPRDWYPDLTGVDSWESGQLRRRITSIEECTISV